MAAKQEVIDELFDIVFADAESIIQDIMKTQSDKDFFSSLEPRTVGTQEMKISSKGEQKSHEEKPDEDKISQERTFDDINISQINQSESIKSDKEKTKKVNPPEDEESSQLHEFRLNSELLKSKPITKRGKLEKLQDSETNKLHEIQPTPNENRMDENNSVLPERKSKIERKPKKAKRKSSNSKRLDHTKETANNCSKDTKKGQQESHSEKPDKDKMSQVRTFDDINISKINQSESIKSDEEKTKSINPPEDEESSQLHEFRLNSELLKSKPITKRGKLQKLQDSETQKLLENQPTPNENRMDENNSVLPERKSKIERKQKKRKRKSSNSKRFDQSKETANNCSKDTRRSLKEEEIDAELLQYQPPTKKAKLDSKQMESKLNDLNEAFGEMLSQADSLASTGDMSKKEVKALKKTFKKMIKRTTKKIKKYDKPTSNESKKDIPKAKGVTQAFGEMLNQADCLDSTGDISKTELKNPKKKVKKRIKIGTEEINKPVKTTSDEREENSPKAKVTKDKKILLNHEKKMPLISPPTNSSTPIKRGHLKQASPPIDHTLSVAANTNTTSKIQPSKVIIMQESSTEDNEIKPVSSERSRSVTLSIPEICYDSLPSTCNKKDDFPVLSQLEGSTQNKEPYTQSVLNAISNPEVQSVLETFEKFLLFNSNPNKCETTTSSESEKYDEKAKDITQAFGEMLSQAESLASAGEISETELKNLKKKYEKMIKIATEEIKEYEKTISNETKKDGGVLHIE